MPVKTFLNRARAFLKIQDGCESFCSYCIVPFARGPLRSLEPQRVLDMLRSLSAHGYREVVLTGIHLGKYGIDLGQGMDLTGLLHLIGKEDFPLRIRLSSLEPNEVDEDLIGMVASETWICRHFHIPLQSGDATILERMNRDYTPRRFTKLIEKIYENIPEVAIGVDVMAGFPGEDQKAFDETFSLIKAMPVSYLHVFPFSPRKGTAAATFPSRVDQGIIKERAAALRSLGREKRRAFYGSCLGKPFETLVEGWHQKESKLMRGTTDNYIPVLFPTWEDLRGRLVTVVVEACDSEHPLGRMKEDTPIEKERHQA